ncbi:SyrP (plasmid) [Pseudonocardia sp. EC080610-09]|nr:SyrP [Pseudonocardia sp. EC080610-09]ALL85395.1 SyrP [Pseudonocardia sp. EC080619-01]
MTRPRGARTSGTPLPSTDLRLERRPGAPALVQVDPEDPLRWIFESRGALRSAVIEHGAVLVRGLGLYDPVLAGDVVRLLADRLMAERETFAPRTTYADRVYSSTRWPPQMPMCPHHELAYCDVFPTLMMFVCLTPPTSGGVTVLVDSTAVLRSLPAGLVRRFEQDGWLLVRTYNDEIGPSWATAFGTGSREAVEHYCQMHAIDLEWRPGGKLRTWQRRPAVRRHPVTEERCWFNDIAYYSEWVFGPDCRHEIADLCGADELPVTTCFGDGTAIGWDIISRMRRAYSDHAAGESWQSGDLLVVDNIRVAHGRAPYTGSRELLVAMADPLNLQGAAW